MSVVDVSDVIADLEEPYTVKTVTRSTTNFVANNTTTTRVQSMMIQIADRRKLNPDTVDWSLAYLLVHSRAALFVGEFITYLGVDHKVIQVGRWLDYGYCEAVVEETKGVVQ